MVMCAPGGRDWMAHATNWPYFVVMLTDAVMKIEAPDGAVSETRRKAGARSTR